MIAGAHVILYSTDPAADREFIRKILKFPYVDAGDGWLLFALPPAELAVHPSEENGSHELYLTCEDLKQTVDRLQEQNIPCSEPVERPWGIISQVTLPGGGVLGVYQPKHPLAHR